jgi:hypothetical protein
MERPVYDSVDAETVVSRPVTSRSRITGTSRSASPARSAVIVEPSHSIDWPAVLASVVTGIAVTTMLIILGVASGLIAGDDSSSSNDIGGILGAVGAWSVVAMLLGTLVGSLLGGRLARWMDRGSIAYHALTSWGVATLLMIALASLVSIGFATATNAAADTTVAADATSTTPAETNANGASNAGANTGTADTTADNTATKGNADDAGDALGGAGLGLTLGMLLTLAVSFAGWWVGSRKRLTDFEREDAELDGTRTVAVG